MNTGATCVWQQYPPDACGKPAEFHTLYGQHFCQEHARRIALRWGCITPLLPTHPTTATGLLSRLWRKTSACITRRHQTIHARRLYRKRFRRWNHHERQAAKWKAKLDRLERQLADQQEAALRAAEEAEPTCCPACGRVFTSGEGVYQCGVCEDECCTTCSDTTAKHAVVCDVCLDGGYEDGYRQGRDS